MACWKQAGPKLVTVVVVAIYGEMGFGKRYRRSPTLCEQCFRQIRHRSNQSNEGLRSCRETTFIYLYVLAARKRDPDFNVRSANGIPKNLSTLVRVSASPTNVPWSKMTEGADALASIVGDGRAKTGLVRKESSMINIK